jgi:hypothetical protein
MAATAAHEQYGNFDPDQFDWGSDEGISLDEIGNPDLGEHLMSAVLALHEDVFDWTYVKRSELRERAGRMYVCKIVMPEEHREWFEKEWPEYVFVWDKATRHHDHPVAHLCTELNEIEMTEDLVRDGTAYIDLFGNPGRDAKYRRKALTLYSLATAKDHLRYYNAGESAYVREIDWSKFWQGGYKAGDSEITEICITHALYYLSIADIGRWVNKSKRHRIRATVHRHAKSHGELNRGEQEYWVSESGDVLQKNTDTGEAYEHPSLEALFHQWSAKTQYGGVSWTAKKMGGDTYQLTFVGCAVELARDYVPLKFLRPETRVEWAFNDTHVRSFLGWTWMSTTKGDTKFLLEDCDLTDKLRRYIAGKPRNARMKSELMNYARRLTNKADIIAIHGGGAHEVLVGRMSDYVENAFYMDARHELEVAMSYFRKNATVIDALNTYYESGKMPLDMAKVQKALKVGYKIVTHPGNALAVTSAGAAVVSGVGLPVAAACVAASAAIGAATTAGVLWNNYSSPPADGSRPPW